MRKKLALICCVILSALLCVFGCDSNPYQNMTIEIAGDAIENNAIHLCNEVKENAFTGGVTYIYDEASFKVKVSDSGKDTDLGIQISGGSEYVDIDTEYLGNGVTKISLKANENSQTGKFLLNIVSNEGNKSLDPIVVYVDLKINYLDFNDSKLQAVIKGNEIDLSSIENLIDFYPYNTTQKDVKYEVIVPSPDGFVDGYVREDSASLNVGDLYPNGNYIQDVNGHDVKYAEIVNDSTLKIYSSYVSFDGQVCDMVFPKMYKETLVDTNTPLYSNVITIKATSKYNPEIFDYLDIEVVEDCGEVKLSMNIIETSIMGEMLNINRNSSNEFDIRLMDSNYGSGFSATYNEYFSNRTLIFSIGNNNDPLSISEYEVVGDTVTEEDDVAVVIIGDGTNSNTFKIQAQKPGTYSHKFIVRNKRFPNVIAEVVVVNFDVFVFPTKISVNGHNVGILEQDEEVYEQVIYNNYPKGSYGTRFQVNMNSDFNYFLTTDVDCLDYLTVRKSGSGTEAVLAKVTKSQSGSVGNTGFIYVNVSSSVEGKSYTMFNPTETFYLSHSFSEIPEDSITFTVYTRISVVCPSYNKEVAEGCDSPLYSYSFKLKIENSIDKFNFATDKAYINLYNDNFIYAEDDEGDIIDPELGAKILTLPIGVDFDRVIKSITYDESLIKVYSINDDDGTIVYAKCNDDCKEGTTRVSIEAFNGLKGGVDVVTYIPTAYLETEKSATNYMPLACEADEYSSGYLYYIHPGYNGENEFDSHNTQQKLYRDYGDGNWIEWGEYTSIGSLFVIINAEQSIKFYDFVYGKNSGEYTRKDITPCVDVIFSYSGYASYSNGKLTTYGHVTEDKDNPVVMVCSYKTAYEDIDEDGNLIYVPVTIEHRINLYIYEPLEGVEVTTSKAVDLYLEDSLGYYNYVITENDGRYDTKYLHKHTIVSTFIPNKIQLGSQWNEDSSWENVDWKPVELSYEYRELLNEPIIKDNGEVLTFLSDDGSTRRTVRYKDLFDVSENAEMYECTVTCKISDELMTWFGDNYTLDDVAIYRLIQNQIDNNHIEFVVSVYIKQFHKLQNINSVRFFAKYADRINSLKLDVEDDGVYFEVRKNENGQYVYSGNGYVDIKYTIDNANAVNTKLEFIKYDMTVFTAEIIYGLSGNSGIIRIKPNVGAVAGISYLTLTTQDNVKNISDTLGYSFYNNNEVLLKSFRIKISNGSIMYPFEIRSINDFDNMVKNDIGKKKYYYYIITRDLNFSDYTTNSINIDNSSNISSVFSLTGKHNYFKNGNEITTYSSIYNLKIIKNRIDADSNIGLFGIVNGSAIILDNISISNAFIQINNNSNYAVNVGILVGKSLGATINACKVQGKIQYTQSQNVESNVGGMVGLFGSTDNDVPSGFVKNLPDNYANGVVATGNNVYVDIEILGNSEVAYNSFSVGGLIGKAMKVNISNINLSCNITTVIPVTMGGLVGYVDKAVNIENIEIVPTLIACLEEQNADTSELIVGGIVGNINDTSSDHKTVSIKNVVISFVDIGPNYSKKEKRNISVVADFDLIDKASIIVGGLIGTNNSNITMMYCYVRSYYTEELNNNSFDGNVYVFTNNESTIIGGLVGVSSNGLISSCYADIDISGTIYSLDDGVVTNLGLLPFGGLVGTITNTIISNCYAICNVNNYASEQLDTNCGMFTNMEFVGDTLLSKNVSRLSNVSDVTYSYTVINGKDNYFADGTNVYAVIPTDSIDTIIDLATYFGSSDIGLFMSSTLGFAMTRGEDVEVSYYKWFYNNLVNTILVQNVSYAYPLLLNGTKVMYDLAPTGISVVINPRNGLYDITKSSEQQVIMFVNRDSNGVTDGGYYEFSLNQSKDFVISLEGTTISTTYITIELNDKIEVLEDSEESVVKIVNNRIYPIAPGIATLTIRSFVVKSIQTQIKIVVVDGITDIEIVPNDNMVYIDEVKDFTVQSINEDALGTQYIPLNKYGTIVEIYDASDDVLANACVKINGVEYVYDRHSRLDNIIVIKSNTLQLEGVTLGNVKLLLTPYIVLDNIDYESIYNGLTGVRINNAYILDISKSIEFEVKAKAVGIENSKSAIALDATNTVTFETTIETANISIVQLDPLDPSNVNYNVTISDDLLVYVGNNDISRTILKDTFICAKVNDIPKYVLTFEEPYIVQYEIIVFKFTSISIVQTASYTGRQHTYKITLLGNVTFDREDYRKNASLYDLNTLTYSVRFKPASNIEISDTTIISIVPNDVDDIFTNFYTSGERGIGVENISYPEENESVFIVPKRAGLLKITLDQEFNNSSYITIMFDKKYEDKLMIGQLAGKVSDAEMDEITSYENVKNIESLTSATTFGLKLTKLSINYLEYKYFNNTYYVQLLLLDNVEYDKLDFVITSYKIDGYSQVIEQCEKECSINIMELPMIRATIDNDSYAVIGLGIKKEISISTKGISDKINVRISQDDGEVSNTDKLYFCDEDGIIVNDFEISYLNDGYKYYLCSSLDNDIGLTYTITLSSQETILGVVETSSCELIIDTVEFEIEDIVYCGNITEMLYGQTIAVEANVKYKVPTIGNLDGIDAIADINAFKESIEEKIKILNYSFAGHSLKDGANDIIKDNISILCPLQSSYIGYQNFEVGSIYGGLKLSIATHYNDDNTEENYYELMAVAITSGTSLLFESSYHYNNGALVAGVENAPTNALFYVISKTINIDIRDNSTYDHPTPIETQDDFINALKSTNGNYILINNLTLENWVPAEANFKTFDGNGYKIAIESFNLSGYKDSKSADVGLFSTISANTLIKNVVIDISPLLGTAMTMLNNVEIVKSSTKETYTYQAPIDLSYIPVVNFGILAGTNNGSVTNVKIVSTQMVESNLESEDLEENLNVDSYLHILTAQGYLEGSVYESNIGGIVGVNASTGAISNSFVGISKTESSIEIVDKPSAELYDNADDKLENVNIYPFVIAGGNNLAGIVATNDGVISNSYVKGLGLYNTFPTVEDSSTAGLVVYNNGLITGSFVEGTEFDEDSLRAKANMFKIESKGYIGGLVFDNRGTIKNSYTNAYLQTQSSFLGGFVFTNESSGKIINCYTTAVNTNSLAVGQFTGVKRSVSQNFGTYENSYYIVRSGECVNSSEDAIAINVNNSSINNISTWNGFSFITGANSDGIWKLEEKSMPQLYSSLIDTISFRHLDGATVDEESELVVYNYSYKTYYLGTERNPLLIENAENFDKFIIDNSILFNNDSNINGLQRIFGSIESNSAVRYVRLVNNLNFENIVTANQYNNVYLYNVIFAGVLDGNGMVLNNLNINTDSSNLDNFGLFGQVGIEGLSSKSVIKNVDFNLRTYKSSGNYKAGVIAGTIINSSIVNVNINGNNQIISAINMAGALAGLVYSDGRLNVSINDVSVKNIKVEATYGSLGGAIGDRSEVGLAFDTFTIEEDGQQGITQHKFKTLKDNGGNWYNTLSDSAKIKSVSYAGGLVGVLYANNYQQQIGEGDYSSYKTENGSSTINNIIVSGGLTISTADNAGGLFGLIAENTIVKNSKFVLSNSDTQLIKAFNFAGGIVGENYGVIDGCSVAYSFDEQELYDSTIIDPTKNRDNGAIGLFDKTDGEPYYIVSIGGIAGYSCNGVIIDSFVKANVIKEMAFVAGGIIGYSSGYNYLGYVYTTGTVYGKYVIGGIIGLQINNAVISPSNQKELIVSDTVQMDYVVALNNYGLATNEVNVLNGITMMLYNNQKVMYTNDASYYQFFIKLPEVGNLPMFDYGETPNISEQYQLSHNSYYVGSVVGKSMLVDDGHSEFYNGEIENNVKLKALSSGSAIYYNNSLIKDLYNDCSNVYSSTFGIVSTIGSLDVGNRQDDYFVNTFSIEDEDLTLYSYRTAFPTNMNSYDGKSREDLTGSGLDSICDEYQFDKIFTTQEYVEQLVGKYAYLDDSSSKVVPNIFSQSNIDEKREDLYDEGGTTTEYFLYNPNKIWKLNKFGLPEISNIILETNGIITTPIELENAILSNKTGVTYSVEEDIVLELNNTITSKSVQYYNANSLTYIGNNENDENGRAEITFNMYEINSIFNVLNGTIFENIDFIINVNKDTLVSALDGENFGLFANSLDGVIINKCSITINLLLTGYTFDNNDFVANNVGLLFGNIFNSTIKNTNIKVNYKTLTINNSKIENFGILAGYAKSSSINNDCSIDINGTNIIINNANNTTSIGGLIGRAYSTTIKNNDYNNINLNMTDNMTRTSANYGGLVGYAQATNIISKSENTNNIKIAYTTSSNIITLSVGAIYGYSVNSKINNFALLTQSNGVSSYKDINLNISNVSNVNCGAFIGCDDGSTQINNCNTTFVMLVSGSMDRANVGGIVGISQFGSGNLLYNVVSESEIALNNNKSADNAVENNIGGAIGFVAGVVGVEKVVVNGEIAVSSVGNNVYVGGLIGHNKSTVVVNVFSVLENFGACVGNNNSYVSGIIGNNESIARLSNGYTYVDLRTCSGLRTSATTNGNISGATSNVFYSQELIGNQYDNDLRYVQYAIGDLYLPSNSDTLNKYGNIYSLYQTGEFDVVKWNNVAVLLPKGLSSSTTINSHERYTLSVDSSSGNYHVITGNNSSIIGASGIYSGVSNENGKATITISGSNKYIISTNSGILSNLYIDLNGTNASFVSTNSGLITNCLIYGVNNGINNASNVNYGIAKDNNGKIIQCGTIINYKPNREEYKTFYGLVKSNGVSGVISNCYSYSFGFTANKEVVTDLYGYASENKGVISHCYFEIPKDMNYDNNIIDCDEDVETIDDLSADYVSNIWYQENGRLQIIGFNTKNLTSYGVKMVYDDVTEINTFNALVECYKDSSKVGKIGYTFYFKGDTKPDYNVIRIFDGEDFETYICGLNNGYIPSNTIVILVGNIDIKNASLLPAITISSKAALVGVNSAKLSFGTVDNKGSVGHEIIKTNNGIFANIVIENLIMRASLQYNTGFAPIITNNGLITTITVSEISIIGSFCGASAGFVAMNNKDIYNVTFANNMFISTSGYGANVYDMYIRNSAGANITGTNTSNWTISFSGNRIRQIS